MSERKEEEKMLIKIYLHNIEKCVLFVDMSLHENALLISCFVKYFSFASQYCFLCDVVHLRVKTSKNFSSFKENIFCDIIFNSQKVFV